jgi:hypothetical protein
LVVEIPGRSDEGYFAGTLNVTNFQHSLKARTKCEDWSGVVPYIPKPKLIRLQSFLEMVMVPVDYIVISSGAVARRSVSGGGGKVDRLEDSYGKVNFLFVIKQIDESFTGGPEESSDVQSHPIADRPPGGSGYVLKPMLGWKSTSSRTISSSKQNGLGETRPRNNMVSCRTH